MAYYVLALPLGIALAFHQRTHMGLQGLWLGMISRLRSGQPISLIVFASIGQVVALFIVGLGEYAVVWLSTDWDKEIQYSIERNREEAKRRQLHEGTREM